MIDHRRPPSSSFSAFRLPSGETALIPSDIELKIPERSALAPDRLHYLIYIPWHEKYFRSVPEAYRDFFEAVLPYLRARTTDVHVATCLPFVKELIAASDEVVDETVITVAFILHDSGWSQMSEDEIAHSLGVTGLALSGAAVDPKARHAVLGKEIAERVLGSVRRQPPLTESQKDLIYKAILYHDKPWELAGQGGLPASVKLVCDVDHLWSFTHENFWQDTARKSVAPDSYLKNLENDLDGYFVTEQGKRKARSLIEERRVEVEEWDSLSGSIPGHSR